jgi:hypothetical protein
VKKESSKNHLQWPSGVYKALLSSQRFAQSSLHSTFVQPQFCKIPKNAHFVRFFFGTLPSHSRAAASKIDTVQITVE